MNCILIILISQAKGNLTNAQTYNEHFLIYFNLYAYFGTEQVIGQPIKGFEDKI